MATTYAWSNFITERNEWGQVTGRITVGEEVTQEQLGLSDLDWQELLDVGAVREQEYPDVPPQVAPAEYIKFLVRRLTEGQLDSKGMQELESFQSVTPNVAADTSDAARGASREVGNEGEGNEPEPGGFQLP